MKIWGTLQKKTQQSETEEGIDYRWKCSEREGGHNGEEKEEETDQQRGSRKQGVKQREGRQEGHQKKKFQWGRGFGGQENKVILGD